MTRPEDLFSVRIVGEAAVVRPHTQTLNFEAAGVLKDYIDDVMLQSKKKSLILDFSEVEFIDSMGIGMLAILSPRVRRGGGKLMLAGVSSIVSAALLMTRVDKMLEMHDTVRDALGADFAE
jgi:anti-anti-sigma factor